MRDIETLMIDDVGRYCTNCGFLVHPDGVLSHMCPKRKPRQWIRGRTLLTAQTRKWTEEQWARNDRIEARMLFENFTDADQGRGRMMVCTFDPLHPDYEQNVKLAMIAPKLQRNVEVLNRILDDTATTVKTLKRTIRTYENMSLMQHILHWWRNR